MGKCKTIKEILAEAKKRKEDKKDLAEKFKKKAKK